MSALITREYQGQSFVFRDDGYFNMTKAAQAYGKETKEFLRLPSTIEYIEALEKVGNSHVYEAGRGRSGGTWAYPKLAVAFARWLDVKFAVFCNMVIDDILRGKAELTITKPAESSVARLSQTYLESLEELVKSMKAQEELQQQNAVLVEANKQMLAKADAFDAYPDTACHLSTTEAAAALKYGSAIRLNRFMRELGCGSTRTATSPPSWP
ncbi:KilA-N domain-containing protein [Stutzerimonas sp. R40042]|uniref:KilA-N domain-containing protein n=1 Tax=Stutzerimonas TaxID=2901164 RepID=UPI0022776C23|nr:KilA-N domain-containing protein [Stutzerimonas sp. R40042]WAE63601.1 KilA-N domain-containing protein [Stutzerimonas sp. R40042]